MATVGFVVDPPTFEPKKIGPVWGTIFFQFEQGCFPGAGWSDIVVPMITESLAVLNRFATGTSGRPRIGAPEGGKAVSRLQVS